MSEYTPTETRLRERVKGSLGDYAHEFGIDGEAAMDEWIDQALAERDNRVRADERAKIEEKRRGEHAAASAQRVPPIVKMADGYAGSTKLDRLAIELMRVWGRVDKTSSVSQHPLGYVATFADMARAVLDWPELADERAKRPDREHYVSEAHRRYSGSGNHPGGERHAFLAGVDAVLSSLALKTETDQELQDRIEVLEKNLAYEVAQKIKLAEQLQAATATDLTLEQARWKMHAGIESRCSEEVAAEVKPIIDLVFSSLALEPEAREDAEYFHDQDGDLWKFTDKGEWFYEEEPGEFRQVLSIDAEDQTLTPVGHAEPAPTPEVTDAEVEAAWASLSRSSHRWPDISDMRAALRAAREVE